MWIVDALQHNRREFTSVLSLIVGVAGLASGAYFYYHGKSDRSVVFETDLDRNIVLYQEPSVKTKLSVLYENKIIENSNVIAVQCRVWNDGNTAIRPENILEPLQLKIGEGAELLDVSVVTQSRPLIQRTTIAIAPGEAGKRTSANLGFSIWEPNDGIVLQVIFAGSHEAPLAIVGTIESGKVYEVGVSFRRAFAHPNDPFYKLDRHAQWVSITNSLTHGVLLVGVYCMFVNAFLVVVYGYHGFGLAGVGKMQKLSDFLGCYNNWYFWAFEILGVFFTIAGYLFLRYALLGPSAPQSLMH